MSQHINSHVIDLVLPKQSGYNTRSVNSLRAKIFNRNINMYLQFSPSIYTDMTQVVEILPREKQGHT